MATQNRISPLASDPAPPNGRRLRAVVVDDMPEFISAISLMLESSGRVDVVGTATDGLIGIRQVQRLVPDLVVIDISMPVMDGLEATMYIKRSFPAIKILIASANHNPELCRAALSCGADSFISKVCLTKYCQRELERLFPQQFSMVPMAGSV